MFESFLYKYAMNFLVVLGISSLLAGVAYGGTSMHDPFYCYATDSIRSGNTLMAGPTSYEAIRRFNFTLVDPHTPTGTPSRFWYFGRYAARFPAPGAIQEMIDLAESSVQADIVRNYVAGRTTLCRLDFEAIRDFDKDTEFANEFTVENGWLILESGLIAMQNIARRFQQKFPNILTQNYSPDRFYFRHVSTERANVSIRAFASGLFGEAESQNVIYEDIPAVDWLLRGRDFCPAFSEEIANSDVSRTAFEQGPEIEEMIEQINRRLGFHTSSQLNYDQIYSMWNWCRHKTAEAFETSNSEIGGNATWCTVFSVAHHQLIHYSIDLGTFYSSGPGVRNQRLLENLNCGIMQDLLAHMQSNNGPTARFFVTHTQDFLHMLHLLGAFRDVWPLHQHNFAQQSNRRWFSSMTVSFSANIVVVRYDCDDGDHDLVFLLNEKPMVIPECDRQTGVCKLSVIVNRFQRFINANCAVSFCSND